MFKALLALLSLCLVCWVIQLLPVISIPLTSPSVNIHLSQYGNYKFGVFGICNVEQHVCSDPRIGYPATNSTFYANLEDPNFGNGGVVLPSDVRYTISKLLVVHVVAFCFSSFLLIVTFILWSVLLIKDIQFKDQLKKIELHEEEPETNAEEHYDTDDHHHHHHHHEESNPKKDEFDLSPYLNIMLTFTLFSVLTTLLAFLADILLFTPNLSYVGWLQLIPIVLMALITSMLCFIKRSISSRKFFESEYQYVNDDMRMMRKNYVDEFWNDNASDDGFFVYTDGFYTRNGTKIDQTQGNTSQLLGSQENIHQRSSRSRETSIIEDYSISSSPRASIELQDLRPSSR
ncbi:pH-response regulator protein palI/RIM9 [Candida viswanathii]|uniref:pH-response regulator protein palI/RIM9 n=1 Tax=Candida viswanathii TaxID=5486 RepID=A0A367XWZ7_9ASCO|nr:pH-response regulator protein palI/RIM9 [Candida viswanathii]